MPRSGAQLMRVETGLAPQALVVSADNTRLYVHNFMGRSVQVVDITPLTQLGELRSTTLATLATVGTEKLAANVLLGKQLFYDARDTRLARDAYMSCASCHHDGGHDGRTWDLTAQGEGLRNTISLRGRAGLGHGRLHWSSNFDEVQDFEGQIRALAGGTGLMSDTLFNTGTRNQPLGTAKAGQSADLDALAAYVASLNQMPLSAARSGAGALTAAAAGRPGGVRRAELRQLPRRHQLRRRRRRRCWPTSARSRPAAASAWARCCPASTCRRCATWRSPAPYLHDGSAAYAGGGGAGAPRRDARRRPTSTTWSPTWARSAARKSRHRPPCPRARCAAPASAAPAACPRARRPRCTTASTAAGSAAAR